MTDSLLLKIPFPVGTTGQNSRQHWSAKAKLARDAKTATYLLVSQKINGDRWPAATMQVAMFFPDRRRRDVFNVIEAIKADIDGIVETGLIPDDDWTHLRPTTFAEPQVDANNPRVELILFRAERI